ncbi:hypothetical protein H6P81_004426 [Aristolochia fimbriata]|uniref:Proteasome assembly chaperone 4 n=1 Tax=Aristolochia fimbriata TaxID=158543 RepID=A0AAV7FI10_ARIFI|nr:hypothetical protein H6P81_004426 [Aristolochia fimbriata]
METVGSSSKIEGEDDSLPPHFTEKGMKCCEVHQPSTVSIDDTVAISCFSEDLQVARLDFQIIRLQKQIYVWIGCSSGKFGSLYAALTTRPNNGPTVASLRGGSADSVGSTIAARIVKKTGLSVILACNLRPGNPKIEASAEKILMEKLKMLGYI